jgi:hypothetical protein
MGLTIGRLSLARAFTLAGKRRAKPHYVAACLAAATASLMLPSAGRAAARAASVGPTSSASVEIRVSVAPQYRLNSVAASSSTAVRGLCIASNGPPMLLPVMLVLEPEAGKAVADRHQLAWCDAGSKAIEVVTAERALIIYPE